jgi:hypothetical protein
MSVGLGSVGSVGKRGYKAEAPNLTASEVSEDWSTREQGSEERRSVPTTPLLSARE